MCYFSTNEIFPVLLKGSVFSIANITARPFSSAASIVVEMTSSPVYILLVSSLIIQVPTFLLHQGYKH